MPWHPLAWSPVKPVLHPPQLKEPCRGQCGCQRRRRSEGRKQLIMRVQPWCCSTPSWQYSLHSRGEPCTRLCPRTPGNSKSDNGVKTALHFQGLHICLGRLFYLSVRCSVIHAYSSDLRPSVSQRALPAAETRSGVYTRDARKAGIELALGHTKENKQKMSLVAAANGKSSTGSETSVPTSSTSSQCTPSPVNPSGQGAHWKPPIS